MYANTTYGGTAGYSQSGYAGASFAPMYSPIYQSSSRASYQPTYMRAESSQPNFSLVDSFLNPNRPFTPLVSTYEDIKPIVDETYKTLVGEELPYHAFHIVVVSEDDFKFIYETTGGIYSAGIMGFCFNKYGKGVSEIYVKQDHMDRLLLTIGHEIGHCMSPALPVIQDEEAKAHAFSLAWMETIRDNNIGGLTPNIALNPARNGIHDVALDFVNLLVNAGASSMDAFKTISQGLSSSR